MRETFSTKTTKDELASKRERLQSQGAVHKPNGMTLDAVKHNPKRANPDELNQTMQATADKKFVETIDVPTSQNNNKRGVSDGPQVRNAATIEYTHAEVAPAML
jgi:hypothetical protein